jgi:hypothetical protein
MGRAVKRCFHTFSADEPAGATAAAPLAFQDCFPFFLRALFSLPLIALITSSTYSPDGFTPVQ